VFIDKPSGVDVEDCARVSNHLTRLFAVEDIDFERAVQLLADKRAKGPAKPKSKAPARRKPAAKKAAPKKPTAKK
jgi:topoisomerase IA-like protein